MEIISSKTNSKVLEAKKLLDKKARDIMGLFLIETKKVVLEAIENGLVPKCFFVLEDSEEFDFSKKFSVPTYLLKKSVFNELSTLVTPDGIVAVFEKKKHKSKSVNGNFLILDNLQNPDNMGAILRSASAFDFNQIYCINCVDEYSPKVLRSSMGNVFKLDIFHIEYDEVEDLSKKANLFVADMDGENICNIKDFGNMVGFVIGNEGNGVSSSIKKLIKNKISIPMQNNVESLNASVSASIAMFQIFSKCHK